ncbi:unnamed protein product [Danaus chrysippus]|uniref:(African queen) hypothetical protein n=1 Tax=Danaus chrysippus TaxID=151541 RepID=A0A8J2QNW1_9NEOP|nr:unnamed protein product [Danaus chrysippus]
MRLRSRIARVPVRMRRQRQTADHTGTLEAMRTEPSGSTLLTHKTRSRHEFGKQGNRKKESVSVETTDNRISRPHQRITDAKHSVHRPNEIAVFFPPRLRGDKQGMQIHVDTTIHLVRFSGDPTASRLAYFNSYRVEKNTNGQEWCGCASERYTNKEVIKKRLCAWSECGGVGRPRPLPEPVAASTQPGDRRLSLPHNPETKRSALLYEPRVKSLHNTPKLTIAVTARFNSLKLKRFYNIIGVV